MKNIHVLPTDKTSRLFLSPMNNLKLSDEVIGNLYQGLKPQNIYITSDEEIGTDEYYFHLKNNEYYNSGKIDEIDKDMKFWRKIILTTDQDLIKDGVQAIDDEFLEWFVKNSNCEFVDLIKLRKEKGYEFLGYEIIIPKEEPNPFELQKTLPDDVFYESLEPKQETLEEVAERLIKLNRQDAFYEGAKWQQEQDMNKYSEEEAFKLLMEFSSRDINSSSGTPHSIAKWFEQFKKK
jgi:hypothetical protein